MMIIKKFLQKILLVSALVCVAVPYAITPTIAIADMPQIGSNGEWNTEDNRQIFIQDTVKDLNILRPAQDALSPGFVPPEAKMGLSFMNAFSHISHILDTSLVRFAIVFIIIMYAFWMMLEAYNLIIAKAKLKDTVVSMTKKGFITFIWVAVLKIGPTETFMMVMNPILNIATMMSDAIFNTVSSLIGTPLPDTCGAIREYAIANISPKNILTPESAASIMCLPTRMSAFCYHGIYLGWTWIVDSIGNSGFAFLCGLGMIAGFVYLAWKFAFIAFGVIADLFLGIIMLPMTAIAESVGQTSYKGIVGDIYNGFIKLFSVESLESQMKRFLNAALHFLVLAVVISICAVLLSGTIDMSTLGQPRMNNTDIYVCIFVVAMAGYLAYSASEIADNIGGKIDASVGEGVKNDVKGLYKSSKNKIKEWHGIIKEARKGKKP